MKRDSRSEARSRIIKLLTDAAHHALGLKESLEDERKALETQDLEGVDTAIHNKSACVQKLKEVEQTRDQLCQSWGFQSGPEQMQDLIDWCDDAQIISHRWDNLLLIAAESNSLNQTNGAIIRLRQQQFEESLAVIRGANPDTDTYGRHGANPGEHRQRSLAEA